METPPDRFPPQIKYIVGNEACERFSFYGMRSILFFAALMAVLSGVFIWNAARYRVRKYYEEGAGPLARRPEPAPAGA